MKYNKTINIGAPYSLNRQYQDNMYKILNMLSNDRIDPEIVSPNYVADYAYNRGISLPSDMIVEISNKYEG